MYDVNHVRNVLNQCFRIKRNQTLTNPIILIVLNCTVFFCFLSLVCLFVCFFFFRIQFGSIIITGNKHNASQNMNKFLFLLNDPDHFISRSFCFMRAHCAYANILCIVLDFIKYYLERNTYYIYAYETIFLRFKL